MSRAGFRAVRTSLALVLVLSTAYGQVGDTLRVGKDTCSYFGERLPEQLTQFASDAEADDVIKRVIGASGLIPNFEVKAAGVPNAAAVIYGDKRFILYSQYFIRDLTQKAGTKWAAISVMAHEIGHHLNGHTLSQVGSRPKLELEADYYSGFILQKLGAGLDDARKAMDAFGSPTGSSTHPAKHERLAAITSGWTVSCNNDPNCGKAQPSPIPAPQPRPEGPAPTAKPGPDSCEYANDGTCDEPDLCKPGTDTSDCKRKPTTQAAGFPSGFGMLVCGCYGFNPPRLAPEPRCQSGRVSLNICPGACPTGGYPYAYVCQ